MEKKHVYSIDAIVGKFKIDSKLKLDILIKVENNGDNSLSQYGHVNTELDDVIGIISDKIRYTYKCMIECAINGSGRCCITLSFYKCKGDEELHLNPDDIRVQDIYNIISPTALTNVYRDGIELNPAYKVFYDIIGPMNDLVEVKITPRLFAPDFNVYIKEKVEQKPEYEDIQYASPMKIYIKDSVPYTVGNHYNYLVRYPNGKTKKLTLAEIINPITGF